MRRFLPTLSALHAFDAAVRYLNFSRAAEDLGVTPSGISRQIRNLEEFLGLTLFERAGPKIVLTEAGQSYHAEIAHLLDRIEEVSIDAVRGCSTRGLLRIALPATLGARWGSPLLARFHQAHPDILFEVSTCGSTAMPDDPEIDVAILRGAGNWAGSRNEMLAAEELVVVGAPRLLQAHRGPAALPQAPSPPQATDPLPVAGAARPGRDLAPLPAQAPTDAGAAAPVDAPPQPPGRLADFTLLQNSSRPSLWLHWLRAAGVEYKGVIVGPRFDLTESLLQAAVAGMGLAVVPEMLAEPELRAGRLQAAFPQRCSSGEAWFLCIREGRQSRRPVQVLRQWLLASIRQERRIGRESAQK